MMSADRQQISVHRPAKSSFSTGYAKKSSVFSQNRAEI